VAATNRDLGVEVNRGRFREDLYYRLNVVSLEMPSLRERRSDIPTLVKFFIDRYAKENGKTIEDCAPAALELLRPRAGRASTCRCPGAPDHLRALGTQVRESLHQQPPPRP